MRIDATKIIKIRQYELTLQILFFDNVLPMTAKFYKLLCQLILAPVNGWHDVSYESPEPARLLSAGYYPLAALAAIAFFLQGLYHPGLALTFLLQKSILIFVQLFISYFIAIFIFTAFVGKYTDVPPTEKKSATYIIMNMSLLALATLVENCAPVNLHVQQFFAIYVAVIMWRGCKFMAVAQQCTGVFMIMAISAIILPSFLLQILFNIIVPSPY